MRISPHLVLQTYKGIIGVIQGHTQILQYRSCGDSDCHCDAKPVGALKPTQKNLQLNFIISILKFSSSNFTPSLQSGRELIRPFDGGKQTWRLESDVLEGAAEAQAHVYFSS